MAPRQVFISHVGEEAEIAMRLKAALSRDFLGFVDAFVSSDAASIAAGEDWLDSVERALQQSSLFIVLCSPASITRPWVNFEAGAAWMRRIPLVPVCHAGLTPGDLPMPLSVRQGVDLDDADGVRRLYGRVAEVLGCQVPACSFADLAREIAGPGDHVRPRPLPPALARDREIRRRLRASLDHARFPWRTLARVATEAAVSEEVAADLLRSDPDVRFAKGRAGSTIVGLRSRVGTGPAAPDEATG
jgi:hypothetical protein